MGSVRPKTVSASRHPKSHTPAGRAEDARTFDVAVPNRVDQILRARRVDAITVARSRRSRRARRALISHQASVTSPSRMNSIERSSGSSSAQSFGSTSIFVTLTVGVGSPFAPLPPASSSFPSDLASALASSRGMSNLSRRVDKPENLKLLRSFVALKMSAASHLRAAASKVTMQQRAAKAFHSDAQDTYFTPRIPPEVKEAIPLMAKLEHAQLRRALQLAVEGLNGRTLSEDDITALQPALGCDGPDCDALVTALYVMVRMAVRAHTKLRAIEKDLTEMHVPEHLVKDIVHVVRSRRHELVQAAIQTRPRFPALAGLQWRVDITISNSSLLRVMKPSILMQMTLSDGEIKTFELPIEQFHRLRFGVAKMLREMQQLERHPIMRLAFDREKASRD